MSPHSVYWKIIICLLPDEEDPVDVEPRYDAEYGHDGEGQDQAAVRHATCTTINRRLIALAIRVPVP